MGLRADHPAGWMAAVGLAGWSGTRVGWDDDRAVLELDVHGIVETAQRAAEAWLDSPMSRRRSVPGTVDDLRALRAECVDWERDWLDRVARVELNPWLLEEMRAHPRRRRWRGGLWRVVRSPLVTFGVAQQTAPYTAARFARQVLDDSGLIVQGLRWSPRRSVVTGLRWTGHAGADWLAWMGVRWTPRPRHLVTVDATDGQVSDEVLIRPVWREPITADEALGLAERVPRRWAIPTDPVVRASWVDYIAPARQKQYTTRTWSVSTPPEDVPVLTEDWLRARFGRSAYSVAQEAGVEASLVRDWQDHYGINDPAWVAVVHAWAEGFPVWMDDLGAGEAERDRWLGELGERSGQPGWLLRRWLTNAGYLEPEPEPREPLVYVE